jgi:hypothetical protein
VTSSTPCDPTRRSPGTGPSTSTSAEPTARPPTLNWPRTCQILDAGQSGRWWRRVLADVGLSGYAPGGRQAVFRIERSGLKAPHSRLQPGR